MKIVLMACAMVLPVTAPAAAQESGQIGIAMGYPSTVSIIWHTTERLALVPKIAFSHNDSESRFESQLTINGVVVSSTTITSKNEGWSVSPGFDVRVAVGKWDNVSAYVAPGFTYLRGSSTITTSTSSPLATVPAETREVKTTGYEVRGTFGAQYTPHRKFAVFGEVGVRYSKVKQRQANDLTSGNTGNVSAVGATFYF